MKRFASISQRTIVCLALAWLTLIVGLLAVGYLYLTGAFDGENSGGMIFVNYAGLVTLIVFILAPPVMLVLVWMAARRAALRSTTSGY